MQIHGLTTLVSHELVELSNLSQILCRHGSLNRFLIQAELHIMAEISSQSGGIITIGSIFASITDIEQCFSGLKAFVSVKFD